ncbi:aminotransferase class I/II-fold pyridoxal phosphate-dependent enzyme [Phyllobacterium myrsinacearum]|uniref:7-keto-8-aminopelargonate synthetase n=1 Tax=Phyllobacterium myrsinacearum TaxID=28101 RepID=A0A2S9J9M6_9HYPH|nr:aminotransferase class I/II-fold pyridoxal phosphate-dependent enzyme [Phyllobacterium myrsinacearum]PRD49498.1 7-keto-8-aminopelargonate synthetase [Phyllobacterium myrsinacearum]PWV83500.1 7-keto-8-aminopelargonate synthetase-like enzyme [Phyllobacterium myrsinacearum]RZU96764.1 7-keto-8-aminopelargonate synthetase-like enzyme [Phyllobacterium myrsinacearum]
MIDQTTTARGVGAHRRNTQKLIEHAAPHFAAAHLQGLMALYAHPRGGRSVELLNADKMPCRIVDFVRCSYLGLDNHPQIIAGAVRALEQCGTLHWSCARTRLNFALLGQLEEGLSDLFSAHVIAYSSVLAANMGALPLLASGHLTQGIKPVMVFDRLAHATLAFHKGTLAEEAEVHTIEHNDLDRLDAICRRNRCVAYICDGIYSMGGAAPIGDLLDLQARQNLFLYIDDAHGISLFGKAGEGYARSHISGPLGDRTIIAASLGKGFGASGGILMLGTAHQSDLFRRFSVSHAFSASPNLAAIGAALASEAVHRTAELAVLQKSQQERLIQFDQLCPTPLSGTAFPIRTMIIGDELATIGAARSILDQGIYVSAIFFPTVAKGCAGLRICPTAGHTPAEITALCRSLAEVCGRPATGA